MSAMPPKADIKMGAALRLLMTLSGHCAGGYPFSLFGGLILHAVLTASPHLNYGYKNIYVPTTPSGDNWLKMNSAQQ